MAQRSTKVKRLAFFGAVAKEATGGTNAQSHDEYMEV
jgi:hypothetical protein